MTKFLKSIAEGYFSRYGKKISECLFVFPNKRSSLFFKNYLSKMGEKETFIFPEIMTITDFVAYISGKTVASKIELLFILYKSYLKLLKEKNIEIKEDINEDFDSFRNWGEIVISDFNTVDQYLVDIEEIFKNVKDYRELSSNFLTDDQKSIIREYFGHEVGESPGRFWKNFDSEIERKGLKTKFVHLWRILEPLYKEFKKTLEEKGLTTPGGVYKEAFETLKLSDIILDDYKKIIFLGFNALSYSEISIFRLLSEKNGYQGFDTFCDFLWDATGPFFSRKNNSASKFINYNVKNFPSPEWIYSFLENCNKELPSIRIISCPSKSAQTKILSLYLSEEYNQETDEEEISESAVVMPDESLLIPTLYALPESIKQINLTMGYPFRLTPINSFISSIRRLLMNMKSSHGEKIFYYKDITRFLTQEYSKLLIGEKNIEKIINYLHKYHKVSLTKKELISLVDDRGDFHFLDFPEKTDYPEEVIIYLHTLLKKLQLIIEEDESRNREGKNLETGFILTYSEALTDLMNMIKKYDMKFNSITLFKLIDRLLLNERIMFQGEPLRGLQIMGTLETRLVDFKRLYILSMNERVFPRRMRTKSFIPDLLRKAYGMPPANYAEEIFSYYFFRMISRAEFVTLFYDSRSGSSRSGGLSRYILQLKHLYPNLKIIEENWNFKLAGKEVKEDPIDINEIFKEKIGNYEKKGGSVLSSSSLNIFRECQKKFFYQYILGLGQEIEYSEYMDAITCGLIVHEMMMDLYLEENERRKFLKLPKIINKEFLNTILEDENRIWNLLVEKINLKHFHKGKNELNTPLKGSTKLVAQQLMEMIKKIIRHDIELAPFELLGCEIEEDLSLNLTTGRKVNFRFAIDRLDKVKIDGKDTLRIIDYKTGAKKRSSDSLEKVFSGEYEAEQIFQLFTYAWLLNKKEFPDARNVRTEIYSVKDFSRKESGLPEIGGKFVENFSEYKEEFSERLEKMIEELFTSKLYKPSNYEENCNLCQFKKICGK